MAVAGNAPLRPGAGEASGGASLSRVRSERYGHSAKRLLVQVLCPVERVLSIIGVTSVVSHMLGELVA